MADDLDKPDDDSSNNEDLIEVLRREEEAAQNWQTADQTNSREKSLKAYDRLPTGDEEDGQSKIITSEYADTVESIMPAMMRAFTSGDQVVQFTPDSAEDEEWARQASAYIPNLMMRENEGFIWYYWFLKDQLMYRLAWACVDIETVQQVKRKTISGLPRDALDVVRQELEEAAEKLGAEITFEETPDEMPAPEISEPQQPEMPAAAPVVGVDVARQPSDSTELQAAGPSPLQTFSATITTKRKVQKVVVDNIASEDGLVSPLARKVDEASFVGYRKKVTRSDLRLRGIGEERIDELAADYRYSVEETQRQPDAVQDSTGRGTRDDSEAAFWLVVAYVRFDRDDDGISEMLRCVYAHAGGNSAQILECDEWTDGIAPVVPGSAILMQHTIPGRSLFDQVKDIQEIGTAVARGMLDNMYLVNRPRPLVTDAVDLASLIDWTPGMPIRRLPGATVDANDVQWLKVPSTMGEALAVLKWKDEIQQKRTGVTPNNQGVPDDAMNPTATGAALISSAADERVNLIVRTIAETSIKRLYRLLYRAVKRAASGPIKYWAGAEWAQVDPTQWPDDMKLEAIVGGVGNKQQQLQNLGMVAQGQEKLAQAQGGTDGPMVTKEHIANTFRKIVEAAGFKSTGQFINSPEAIKSAGAATGQTPPQQSPEMALAQSQIALAEQATQADLAIKRQKAEADIAIANERAKSDIALARFKAIADVQIQREKAGLSAQVDMAELNHETSLKAFKIATTPHPGPGATEIRDPA